MFKKVLFPTDFSENSYAIMPYLKKLKLSGTKEIVILHVLDMRYSGVFETTHAMGEMGGQNFDVELFAVMEKSAARKLALLKNRLGKDFKVKTLLAEGVPFKEIVACAEREKVSLIAIGSHGKSNIEDMLLGSVTEKVVRKSKKPCLVVKR
ncbi:MAG TPA: universal stress protein [Spirochaetota bacterium]|nr:universal stress protein [Spirochaetota bacterium]HPC41212.1 universal stress protein [Spirochaetota bacterium]HPL17487.1 universal stress protein [Spirochaetota bacterium]HQF08176.1 universal stress protein [Spirochaetota bacterium]HQH96937.1 universal stress protein [Spirochaetota bacterium]